MKLTHNDMDVAVHALRVAAELFTNDADYATSQYGAAYARLAAQLRLQAEQATALADRIDVAIGLEP